MWRILGLFVVGALVTTACGGDGGGPLSAGATTTREETAGPRDGTTDPGNGPMTLPGSAGVPNIPGLSPECAAAFEAITLFSQGLFIAFGIQTDLDLSEVEARLQEALAAAPPAIRADLQILVNAFVEFAAAARASGYDPASGAQPTPDQERALQEATEALDRVEVEAAADNLEAYLSAQCGEHFED